MEKGKTRTPTEQAILWMQDVASCIHNAKKARVNELLACLNNAEAAVYKALDCLQESLPPKMPKTAKRKK